MSDPRENDQVKREKSPYSTPLPKQQIFNDFLVIFQGKRHTGKQCGRKKKQTNS